MKTTTDIDVVCDRQPHEPHRRNKYCINPREHFPQHEAFEARITGTPQPAPETGEWVVECQLVKVAEPPRGRVVVKDTKTLRVIVSEDSPARWEQALIDYAQIVRDHTQREQLITALIRARNNAQVFTGAQYLDTAKDGLREIVRQIDAALTAAGVKN